MKHVIDKTTSKKHQNMYQKSSKNEAKIEEQLMKNDRSSTPSSLQKIMKKTHLEIQVSTEKLTTRISKINENPLVL